MNPFTLVAEYAKLFSTSPKGASLIEASVYVAVGMLCYAGMIFAGALAGGYVEAVS